MNVPRIIRRLFRRPYDGLRHFGVVDEGVLYRCGQPRPEELEQLIARHGIRTVVSLRGRRNQADPDEWESAERAVCERHIVLFESVPCNHRNPPTQAQVRRFLDLCRSPERRPVLVHCRLGQQRTLLFCALYQIHVRGMPVADAVQEMDSLGFNVRHRRHQQLLASLYEHAGRSQLAAL